MLISSHLNMIDKALHFISAQINHYLHIKLGDTSATEFIRPENIAWNDNAAAPGAAGGNTTTNMFVTLVNIEEDRISKSQDNYVREGNTVVYRNPKIHLNLYLLFATNFADYKESLKMLSYIIQFFQYKNVFTTQNSPALPPAIKELIFDLVTITFQDLNNLWGILGSKYLPSVMYKVRLITISEDMKQGDAPLLTEIIINDKTFPVA